MTAAAVAVAVACYTVQDPVQVTLADLQLAKGTGALPVHLLLSWGVPDRPLLSAGASVPRGSNMQQGSALGPADQILCSVLRSGWVLEEVVTVVIVASLPPCWVPHRPQEGRL